MVLGTIFQTFVLSVSEKVLGTLNRKHQDLFDDQDADIQTSCHSKNQLLKSHLNDPDSIAKRDAYLKAKRDSQRDLRSMQNDSLSQKYAEIEAHAAPHNSKEFYRSLNAIYSRLQQALLL